MRCLFCGVEVQKPGPCEKCRQERIEKMVEETARARAQAAQAAQARQAGATAGAPTPVETVAGPKPLPRFRRTALALGGLFLFDLGFSGQGFFCLLTAVAGSALLIPAALWALLRKRRAIAVNRALRAAMYVLLGVATIGALRFHSYTARTHAGQSIDACRSYKAAHGRYPRRLA